MVHGEIHDDANSFRRTVGGQLIDTSQWVTPDEGALEGQRRVLYLARKQAVSLYLSGAPGQTIKQLTSFGAKQAYRLIRERCREVHADGRPYGWRGMDCRSSGGSRNPTADNLASVVIARPRGWEQNYAKSGNKIVQTNANRRQHGQQRWLI
jgi:hypothetical protein